ncbi:rhodanese-like domain-containing protein [Aquibacillus koreensis]|uniref:Rhodanese-like domain-containing protein n=1 Tax=Aquibacillus koreensis TaxID=279446 RepID=A0A9X3WK00_9BACI|nr:rhodanese-like domain-containing protein [Aquibacillus koreensis]MCT2536762.1 rhodanese-like domain-containing protein [Aquibacillus koreensis]MDC3421482.1 rhodanese-like domain-containing protein [Aquibacillus koreensis]
MPKQVTPEEVSDRIKQKEKIHVLDVRENDEVAEGKIPRAKHIPLGHLAIRKAELEKDKAYTVVCRSGNRSKAACGILTALGFEAENMVGGMQEYKGELER